MGIWMGFRSQVLYDRVNTICYNNAAFIVIKYVEKEDTTPKTKWSRTIIMEQHRTPSNSKGMLSLSDDERMQGCKYFSYQYQAFAIR